LRKNRVLDRKPRPWGCQRRSLSIRFLRRKLEGLDEKGGRMRGKMVKVSTFFDGLKTFKGDGEAEIAEERGRIVLDNDIADVDV